MEWITAQQAAEKWEISARTAQDLCVKGRIPGAERWGRTWMIPADAPKPMDKRTKAARSATSTNACMHMPKQTPLLHLSNFYNTPGSKDSCLAALSQQPETADLFSAWMLFMQGKVEQAVALAKPLLRVDADFYATLSVGSVLCACALWRNDAALYQEGFEHMQSVRCSNSVEREMRDFWLAVADADMRDGIKSLDWFCRGDFEHIPEDALPAVWFYYARYLHCAARDLARGICEYTDVSGLGLYRAFPYAVEPLVTLSKRSGAVLAELCLRLLCTDAYLVLHDMQNAVRHLDAALRIAVPDKLYGILAEFRGLFNTLMDERLSLIDPGAAKEVEALYRSTRENWTKLLGRPMAYTLSNREYQVAQLVSLGLSNSEIATRLHISTNTVKSAIAMIKNKTGTRKRSELGTRIL